MSSDTCSKTKPSAPRRQAKPIPRVLELNLSLPEALADELDRLSMRSGMFVEDTAACILEAALSRSRRVLVPAPLPGRSPSPAATVPLKVPVTRKLYYHLLQRSRVSGRSMEELAVRTLQSTEGKEKAVAPACEALRQLYLARLAEVQEEKTQRLGPGAESDPAPLVLGKGSV